MSLRVGTVMPSLASATEWINGKVTPEDLTSRPVLVQFLAASCPLCKMNLPIVQQWGNGYGAQGLRVVSVHMPRNEADMSIETIKQFVKENEITEPCAIDNDHIIGDRFQTDGLWPYYFLFDRELKLRLHAAGPLGLRLIENSLKRLLEQEQVKP